MKEGNMSKQLMFVIIALMCCFAFIACSTAKAPAEAAIESADKALADIKPEASLYIPNQLKEAEDALASAKENLRKGEYQLAIKEAKKIAGKAKDLAATVAANKYELSKTWQDMSGQLTGMVNALQSRIRILSKSPKLPAGLSREKLESTKASLPAITQTLTEASEAFKSGNLLDAVNKATTVKEKAIIIMSDLGMKVSESAK
jgi:hypothetical protein